MTAHARDGVTVQGIGNIIKTNNGETYERIGSLLTGPYGVVSHTMATDKDAFAFVVACHGGKDVKYEQIET